MSTFSSDTIYNVTWISFSHTILRSFCSICFNTPLYHVMTNQKYAWLSQKLLNLKPTKCPSIESRNLCSQLEQVKTANTRYMHFHTQRSGHYSDVIMVAMASQITSLTIVYSTVYSGADQRKHQSSASLAFVPGIHRWQVNSPHKRPATRKMFPFDDAIMFSSNSYLSEALAVGHEYPSGKQRDYIQRFSGHFASNSVPNIFCILCNCSRCYMVSWRLFRTVL